MKYRFVIVVEAGSEPEALVKLRRGEGCLEVSVVGCAGGWL